MKKLRDIEYVGWGFFSIVAVFTIPFGVYVCWQITYDATTNIMLRIGVGGFGGLVLAAIIAASVNEVLHRRNKKKYLQERKKNRKSKKRKKKKKK